MFEVAHFFGVDPDALLGKPLARIALYEQQAVRISAKINDD